MRPTEKELPSGSQHPWASEPLTYLDLYLLSSISQPNPSGFVHNLASWTLLSYLCSSLSLLVVFGSLKLIRTRNFGRNQGSISPAEETVGSTEPLQIKAGVHVSCAALGNSVQLDDQTSVQCKASVFHLMCMSTHYMQGDRCFGPSEGRTFQQMEIHPSSCSVGKQSLTSYP